MCYRKRRSARDLPLKAGLEVRDDPGAERTRVGVMDQMFGGSALNPSRTEVSVTMLFQNTLVLRV